MKPFEDHPSYVRNILLVVSVCLLASLVYGYIVYAGLKTTLAQTRGALTSVESSLLEREARVIEFETLLTEIQQKYTLSEENASELSELLTEEKDRNEEFEDQISDISGTVGKLDKLSKLDPELLMKYSKVYFLNEHYAPAGVTEIPAEFRFKKDEPEYIDKKVWPFLEDLLEDAKQDGVELLVISGYRSYDEQKGLKGAYSVQYGSGANAFSADQGYSEHQLGTTVDFSTSLGGGSLSGFEKTESYAWLLKYGHKYGFVLSYPENNAYYIFEPWHWRFVGENLADDLHDDKMSFYDLEQRKIDAYLISIFD